VDSKAECDQLNLAHVRSQKNMKKKKETRTNKRQRQIRLVKKLEFKMVFGSSLVSSTPV